MGEFRYIEGNAKEMQKLLNQWKHQYTIAPIETQIVPRGDEVVMIYMLLWREPIKEAHER